jgi:uncharacterized damage-inducible protein DinB
MNSDFIGMLRGHNAWATSVLIDDAAKLTHEQFHRRFEIGLGSVHDTLRHILGAMLRWADRIGGREEKPSIEKDGKQRSAAELRELLAQADADLGAVAEAIERRGGWNESMEFVVEGGPTYRFSRAAAMLHVLTHGMHHRAQVLNMRRQLGLPALGLDLDVVEWECVQSGQIKL